MAVTIEKRPIGVVLNETGIIAVINSDYSSAFATVNSTAHGLSSGSYVYIKSNVENYNGFWKISVTNSNEFLLVDNPYVAWVVDANVTYYTELTTHGWSCVHLPIVYELSNTRFPNNTVDTVRTISSISNDNGYVNLNLSGSLGTFEELAFIKISNASDANFNGIYQIIDKIATNDVTVNLGYSSTPASGITGASVQLYYSNYNFVVKVYAGLNASHEWADQKPYELAATLQIIPDDSNRAKFSINEILKPYVSVENNLTLPSLPLNLDAFTQFYIEVGEQYDTSNGYTITTLTSAFAADTFEGYAVNAKLAFKNVHSGYLSDYLMNNSTAKFLTIFAIPVLFGCSEDLPNCYNEISFIKENDLDLVLHKDNYANNVLLSSEQETVTGDAGLYRLPISPDCGYDSMIVYFSQALSNQNFDGLSPWVIANTSANFNAAYSANTIVFSFLTAGVSGTNDRLRQEFYPVLGYAYSFNFNIVIQNYASGNVRIIGRFLDSADNTITLSSPIDYTANGSYSGSISLQENTQSNIDQIAKFEFSVAITSSSSGTGPIVTLSSLSTEGPDISERKQLKVDCGCADQEVRLSWMNNLGGFDSWVFTGQSEHTIDISDSGETSINTFPEWPASYGEFADTDRRKQTYRTSAKKLFIYSQQLTQEEADGISYIKSSPLVQIVNSRTDRRTVIVDTDSFTKYKDGDKTYYINLSILYTDDIPSQTV